MFNTLLQEDGIAGIRASILCEQVWLISDRSDPMDQSSGGLKRLAVHLADCCNQVGPAIMS